MKHTFSLALIVLVACTGLSQEIVNCPSGTSFWFLPGGNTNYCLTLPANSKGSNLPQVIQADDITLQYLVVDAKQYKESDKDDDTSILVKFVSGESSYMAEAYGSSFNMQMQLEDLGNGKKALYWFFDVPEGTESEVLSQHFIQIVVGDKIFGLASSRFEGQTKEEIRVALVKIVASLKTVKNKTEVCK